MPKNRTGHRPDDPRNTMERILSRHDVRGEARRRILEVVNILTLAKSQLQGHLSDRKAEIQRLTGELQTARTKNSEDGIIQLYNAGAKLIEQQAGEIKGLKADLQRAKDALDKQGRHFAQGAREQDNHIATTSSEKAALSGHLALPVARDATTEGLKKQLQDSRNLADHLQSGVRTHNKVIEDLHKREAEVRSSLAGERAANANLRSSMAREKAANAELQRSLRKAEERCFGYMMTAEEQQRHIDRLAQENARLLDGRGRGFNGRRH